MKDKNRIGRFCQAIGSVVILFSLLLSGQTGCITDENGRQPGYSVGLPVYSGDNLRNIFYPLGGVGTGDLLIGGRGNIQEFENLVERTLILKSEGSLVFDHLITLPANTLGLKNEKKSNH